RPGADVIAAVVTEWTTDGAIVLLHDGGGERQGTVNALRGFLPVLAARYHPDALPPGIELPRRHGVERPLNPRQVGSAGGPWRRRAPAADPSPPGAGGPRPVAR